MPLSQNHLTDVCLLDCGHRTCRYLSRDDNDWEIYYCLKRSPKKDVIDAEVDSYVQDMVKAGKDPQQDAVPLGDNCDGYPVLKHKEQGYDV